MSQEGEQQPPYSDAASTEVQHFYERYPYPLPVESLDKYQLLWKDRLRCRSDYHLFWPARSLREEFSILVAGCGTSQAAKYALRWPAAHVTGIDFSAKSVHCTEKLRRQHKLDNLQIHQLPVERAGDLETTFDHIVCTGVLHHLPDPDAGLSALRSVLRPEGAMHLMVYAPYGRTGVYMLQEFCSKLGVRAADDGIRDLMTALGALPPGHPLGRLIREAPDFQHVATVADALLNPRDRAYSVPQFFDFIEKAGMTFGRWIKQAPYLPQCGVMAQLPQASLMARLPPVEQSAAVELFRGTMVRHSAVVYRDDATQELHQIRCATDGSLDYVPIRMADTICVQERLPPGAAAVLINRSHPYTDLFLPINAAEKRLFDAIDGIRTIARIAEHAATQKASASSLVHTLAFFERLWWYDQVVFDTSQRHDGI